MTDSQAPRTGLSVQTAERADLHCPYFQQAVEMVGRRWTGAVLLALARGAGRYHEIHRAIPGISERLLVMRLKELEGAGVVVRLVAPSSPVQVSYGLTPKGSELAEAVQPLLDWGQRHLR